MFSTIGNKPKPNNAFAQLPNEILTHIFNLNVLFDYDFLSLRIVDSYFQYYLTRYFFLLSDNSAKKKFIRQFQEKLLYTFIENKDFYNLSYNEFVRCIQKPYLTYQTRLLALIQTSDPHELDHEDIHLDILNKLYTNADSIDPAYLQVISYFDQAKTHVIANGLLLKDISAEEICEYFPKKFLSYLNSYYLSDEQLLNLLEKIVILYKRAKKQQNFIQKLMPFFAKLTKDQKDMSFTVLYKKINVQRFNLQTSLKASPPSCWQTYLRKQNESKFRKTVSDVKSATRLIEKQNSYHDMLRILPFLIPEAHEEYVASIFQIILKELKATRWTSEKTLQTLWLILNKLKPEQQLTLLNSFMKVLNEYPNESFSYYTNTLLNLFTSIKIDLTKDQAQEFIDLILKCSELVSPNKEKIFNALGRYFFPEQIKDIFSVLHDHFGPMIFVSFVEKLNDAQKVSLFLSLLEHINNNKKKKNNLAFGYIDINKNKTREKYIAFSKQVWELLSLPAQENFIRSIFKDLTEYEIYSEKFIIAKIYFSIFPLYTQQQIVYLLNNINMYKYTLKAIKNITASQLEIVYTLFSNYYTTLEANHLEFDEEHIFSDKKFLKIFLEKLNIESIQQWLTEAVLELFIKNDKMFKNIAIIVDKLSNKQIGILMELISIDIKKSPEKEDYFSRLFINGYRFLPILAEKLNAEQINDLFEKAYENVLRIPDAVLNYFLEYKPEIAKAYVRVIFSKQSFSSSSESKFLVKDDKGEYVIPYSKFKYVMDRNLAKAVFKLIISVYTNKNDSDNHNLEYLFKLIPDASPFNFPEIFEKIYNEITTEEYNTDTLLILNHLVVPINSMLPIIKIISKNYDYYTYKWVMRNIKFFSSLMAQQLFDSFYEIFNERPLNPSKLFHFNYFLKFSLAITEKLLDVQTKKLIDLLINDFLALDSLLESSGAKKQRLICFSVLINNVPNEKMIYVLKIINDFALTNFREYIKICNIIANNIAIDKLTTLWQAFFTLEIKNTKITLQMAKIFIANYSNKEIEILLPILFDVWLNGERNKKFYILKIFQRLVPVLNELDVKNIIQLILPMLNQKDFEDFNKTAAVNLLSIIYSSGKRTAQPSDFAMINNLNIAMPLHITARLAKELYQNSLTFFSQPKVKIRNEEEITEIVVLADNALTKITNKVL